MSTRKKRPGFVFTHHAKSLFDAIERENIVKASAAVMALMRLAEPDRNKLLDEAHAIFRAETAEARMGRKAVRNVEARTTVHPKKPQKRKEGPQQSAG